MKNQKKLFALWLLALVLLLGFACSSKDRGNGALGTDNSPSPADSDTDTDGDSDSDGDADGDADGDQDWEPDTSTSDDDKEVDTYIWIANSVAGTLSKVNTRTAQEEARYWTSSQKGRGDPSRTSVNMHGDMVVTNRQPTAGLASVTKFASSKEDCKDRNKNDKIDTSSGPKNILEWGEDECMLWNTSLPGSPGMNMGARATAWDGLEDPETGKGGHVFIGTTGNVMTQQGTKKVFKLDGDTGDIIASNALPGGQYGGAYGGAVDGKKKGGTFWIVNLGCPMSGISGFPMPGGPSCKLVKVNMDTLDATSIKSNCGYGISIDGKGRIWTAGSNCVQRYDPKTDEYKNLKIAGFARGIAVDGEGSVWTAESGGDVIQIDEEQVTVTKRFQVGKGLSPDAASNSLVGVAVDYDGFVWAVSQGENAAHKIDPKTYTHEKVPVGRGPYTYSDMTGHQLKIAVGPVLK